MKIKKNFYKIIFYDIIYIVEKRIRDGGHYDKQQAYIFMAFYISLSNG